MIGSNDTHVWPVAWSRRPGIASWITVLVTATLAAVSGIAGLAALALSDALVAVLGLSFSVGMLGAATVVAIIRLRVRRRAGRIDHRIGTIHSGLVFRYDRAAHIAHAGMAAGFAGTAVALIVFGVAEMPSPGPAGLVGFLLLGGISLYLLAFLVAMLTGQVRRGHLAVTNDGIEHRSWVSESAVRWADVRGVDPISADGQATEILGMHDGVVPFRYTARFWRMDELGSSRSIVVRGRWLSVDPALLLRVVRFYHEHPRARHELDTPAAAIEQIRRGDLPPL